jgi:molybdate transport system substrate-binding protein
MKTVILAAVTFAILAATPALWLSLALFSHSPRRPDVVGDFLLAAYLVGLSSSLATVGFLIPTASSAMWRRLAVSRAVLIAGALGLVAPVVSLLVAALSSPALLPLFRSAPWLATALFYGLPGVVLGAAALLVARTWRAARPKALAVALALLLAQPILADAAELRVWGARAIATVLAEIGPEFERTTGHTLMVSSDLPPAFVRRAEAGEPFDIFASGSAPVEEWIKAGRLVAEKSTDIARSGIGVEVRAGARKPDISSVDAFRRALLDARSIAFLRVGSGLHVARVLERLGIAEAVKSKVTRPDSDIVSELVARGEVELGMVVITQILTTPGVELVGPLPAEIQSYVEFTAGVSATSKAPDAARQLIKLLTGPTAIPVIRAQGMEPAPWR